MQVGVNLEPDNTDPPMNAVVVTVESYGVAITPAEARRIAQELIDAARRVEKHVEQFA